MDDHICGVYYSSKAADGYQRCYLPQAKFEARTAVLVSVARTTLTQTFVNHNMAALSDVRYAFPLRGGVSVVAFECRVGADRGIRDWGLDRQVARTVYGADGQARGKTPDQPEPLPSAAEVFTAIVGDVPARTELRVVVSYIGELKHHVEFDGLRFTLPNRLAPGGHGYAAGSRALGSDPLHALAEYQEALILMDKRNKMLLKKAEQQKAEE